MTVLDAWQAQCKEKGKLIFTHGFGGHSACSDLLTALRPVLGVDYVDMKEHLTEQNFAHFPVKHKLKEWEESASKQFLQGHAQCPNPSGSTHSSHHLPI